MIPEAERWFGINIFLVAGGNVKKPIQDHPMDLDLSPVLGTSKGPLCHPGPSLHR